jgi:HPt (histidine-containing phosphotransfer) domain-containing protein
MVWIFARKSKTCRTLGSHQIRVFCRRLEQLAGQEARREHKEASAHALEVKAPSKEDRNVVEARSNHSDAADPV